jgi:hypothetical protein
MFRIIPLGIYDDEFTANTFEYDFATGFELLDVF